MNTHSKHSHADIILFVLVLVTFFTSLYMKGLNSGIPLHYDDLGYSATVGGTFVAVFTLASTVMRLVGGQLTDHFPHFKVLVASLVGSLLGVLFPALWSNFYVDMASRVIQGASFALATNVMTVAVMGSASKKHLGKRVGIKGAGTSLGTMLGALVATGLLDHRGYQAFYWFYTLLMGLSLGIVYLLHWRERSWAKAQKNPDSSAQESEAKTSAIPQATHPTAQKPTGHQGSSSRLRELLAPYFIPDVIPYLIISFVRRAPKGFCIAFILVFAKHAHIASGALFFAVVGAAMLACRLLCGKLFDSDRVWLMMPIFCAQAAGFGLLALFPSFPTLMIAALGYGIAVGTTSPFIKALTVKGVPKEHWGVVNGELYFFGDLGKALGAFLGGVIIDGVGKLFIPQIAFGFTVITALGTLFTLLWSQRRGKRRQAV